MCFAHVPNASPPLTRSSVSVFAAENIVITETASAIALKPSVDAALFAAAAGVLLARGAYSYEHENHGFVFV